MLRAKLVFFLLFLTFLASCSKQLGYDGLQVGDHADKFFQKYSNAQCNISNSKKTCQVQVSNVENISVGVNKDDLIYEIQVSTLVEGLTFEQVLEQFKPKYGDKLEINEGHNIRPWARWCLSQSCDRGLVVEFQTIKPRDKLEKTGLWVEVSPCDIWFPKSEKCEKSTHFISVTYSDKSLPAIWLDKNDSQLKKFQ